MRRRDFSLITSWVRPRTRILDLGCGDGALLKNLQSRKGCGVQGVELDPTLHLEAVRQGIPAMQIDIDKDLGIFSDSSYDVVILSRTLQAVRHPQAALNHMLRIAPAAIVSMPNFAYWRNRLRLLGGHAPVSRDLPFRWHESPNVHFGSLKDLEDLFSDLHLTVSKCAPLTSTGGGSILPRATRNWTAGAALYELRKS